MSADGDSERSLSDPAFARALQDGDEGAWRVFRKKVVHFMEFYYPGGVRASVKQGCIPPEDLAQEFVDQKILRNPEFFGPVVRGERRLAPYWRCCARHYVIDLYRLRGEAFVDSSGVDDAKPDSLAERVEDPQAARMKDFLQGRFPILFDVDASSIENEFRRWRLNCHRRVQIVLQCKESLGSTQGKVLSVLLLEERCILAKALSTGDEDTGLGLALSLAVETMMSWPSWAEDLRFSSAGPSLGEAWRGLRPVVDARELTTDKPTALAAGTTHANWAQWVLRARRRIQQVHGSKEELQQIFPHWYVRNAPAEEER